MSKLTLAYRDPCTIKPDPRNARTHSKKQVAQIAASIAGSTFANPILVDEAGVIIAGHARLLAAKSLALSIVPVVTVPGLGDVQKRALRLADNKIAQGAGWDMDLLRQELKEIELTGFDLTLTGFAIGEIDALRLVGDPDDDLVPDLPAITVAKYGDVFIAGPHRIGCGDGVLLRLSYLAPDIVAAILEGWQPAELTRQKLARCNVPLDWLEQRAALGFCH